MSATIQKGRGYASLQPRGANGSSTGTPVGSKCRTLRVTTVKPCSSAVAAISSSAFMAEGAREPAPPTRRGQVDGENSLPVQREHTVQPCGQRSGKRRVTVPLAYDSPLNLAGGHRAGCGGEPAGRVLGCPVLPARGRPERRLRSGGAPHGRRRRACDGRGSENGVRSARPGGVRLSQPSLNSRARGARDWCEATGVDRARSSRNSKFNSSCGRR